MNEDEEDEDDDDDEVEDEDDDDDKDEEDDNKDDNDERQINSSRSRVILEADLKSTLTCRDPFRNNNHNTKRKRFTMTPYSITHSTTAGYKLTLE